MNKRVLTFLMFLSSCSLLLAQDIPIRGDEKSALNFDRPVEGIIKYRNKSLVKELDYELLPINENTFKLKFINQPSDYLDIKIYDVIGNLILKESVTQAKDTELEYQFDEVKSKIFVIKVKSGGIYLTKKINL